MNDFDVLGRLLIIGGGLIALLGFLIYVLGGNIGFLGNLPGDIRIERENFTFYFPLTTMILISLILNLLIRVFNIFFR